MDKNHFTGEAKGDIHSSTTDLIDKALNNALAKAKDSLQTSLVQYEIIHTNGIYGGFAEVHNLLVTIKASAPQVDE